jgi:hypothetical protein
MMWVGGSETGSGARRGGSGRRWSRVLVGVALLSGALAVGPAIPAARAAATTTCQGTSVITYEPGLTETPRAVHYQESDLFSVCASSDPTLRYGIATATADVIGTCTGLPIVLRDPGYTIAWNNGASSVVDLIFTDAIVAGTEQVTGTGTVTSGEFAGGNATLVWIYPVLNPVACLTPTGVTSQTGSLTAQITAP